MWWQGKNKFVWFIWFTVFCVYEYRFHSYTWTIIGCLVFYFLLSKKIILLWLINFKLQILVSIIGKPKWQWKVLVYVNTSLLPSMYISIIIMTWLNCYKHFWWCYYADAKDTVFVWFCFLVWVISRFYWCQ